MLAGMIVYVTTLAIVEGVIAIKLHDNDSITFTNNDAEAALDEDP